MDELDLSDFFQTKDQANDCIIRLGTLSEKIYNTNFNLEKELTREFGIKKKDAFIKLLRDNNIDTKSNSVLKAFLNTVIEKAKNLPLLSLTVAFAPKEQTLKALSQWCLLNINKQALFDITVDPNLIAGAVVNFKGKSMDFSMRPHFDRIVEDVLKPQAEKQTEEKPAAKHLSGDNLSLGR